MAGVLFRSKGFFDITLPVFIYLLFSLKRTIELYNLV